MPDTYQSAADCPLGDAHGQCSTHGGDNGERLCDWCGFPVEEKPPVPHEKVVQIAENYRELELLRKKQAATRALMIRACLQRIVRQPDAFADTAARRKIAAERSEAIVGLEQLAAMLDRQAKLSDDPTPIDGRKE